MLKLGVKKLFNDAVLPAYQTLGAAAFDIAAHLGDTVLELHGVESVVIGTGLAFDIPDGYGMIILSRSGHGFKYSVRLANAVGLIDSDYTGEVKVKLTKDDRETPLTIKHGDRIAQAIILPLPQVELFEIEEMKTTERGSNGFGSTGQ